MAKDTTRTEAAELDLEENARQIKEAREKLEKDTAEKKGKYAAFMQELPEEEQAKNSPEFDRAKEILYKTYMNNPLEKAAIEQDLEMQYMGANALKAWIKDRYLWELLSNDEIALTGITNGLNSTAHIFSIQLELYKAFYQYDPQKAKRYETQIKALQETAAIFPFLLEELKKPIYGGKTPADLFEEAEKDKKGQPVKDSLYNIAILAALKALKPAPKKRTNKAPRLDCIVTSSDPINRDFWKNTLTTSSLEIIKATEEHGFWGFKVADLQNATVKINTRALIESGYLKEDIDKFLTPFDKRALEAAHAYYLYFENQQESGNTSFGRFISVTQLFHTMGNEGAPNGHDLERLKESLFNMRTIDIDITSAACEKFGYKEIKNLNAPLISFNMVTLQDGNDYIYITACPPLLACSKALNNQLKTEKFSQLATAKKGQRMTNNRLIISDYLRMEIDRIKKALNDPKKPQENPATLLLATMCEKCGLKITYRAQKTRIVKKAADILEYMKEQNTIINFTISTDKERFFIELPQPNKTPPKRAPKGK